MLPASNAGAGGNFAFPDVCATPAGPAVVPMPYPNLAFNAMAFPFSPTVRFSFMNALNMGSMIPMTSGDEGGVAHPMVKGPSRYSMGNPKVFISGLPGVSLGCPTSGNNMNAPVGAAVIPSATNVFLSDASASGWATYVPMARVSDEEDSWRWLGLQRLTAHSAAELAEVLARDEVERLVIDLRGNPGGPLDAARRVLEELLPRGAHLYTRHEVDGDEMEVRSRHEGRRRPRIVVLVDGGTASAAEVVVAALRHHGRATIVGSTTYGKGTVQVGRHSPRGWTYAQAAECTGPGGKRWHGVGLEPDIRCEGAEVVAALRQAFF